MSKQSLTDKLLSKARQKETQVVNGDEISKRDNTENEETSESTSEVSSSGKNLNEFFVKNKMFENQTTQNVGLYSDVYDSISFLSECVNFSIKDIVNNICYEWLTENEEFIDNKLKDYTKKIKKIRKKE